MVLAESWYDTVTQWEVPALLRAVAWVLLGLVLTWLARFLIRRIMRGVRFVQTTTPGPEGVRADMRLRTVRSVLTSSALAFVWVFVAFGIAQALNIRLSGLVVWTTVIGGAFAFGAQQIVRDLLAGFFMFMEDQYGVGDLVDVGHATGTVEDVTLRVTRLRDGEGRVWFVPNGQIVRVANLSHDWAQAVLDVPVPLSADLDAVTATLLEIGRSLRAEAVTADLLLDDPQVLGVQDVQDDRAVLRFSVKTKAAAQFEVLRRMRAAIIVALKEGRLPPLEGGVQTVVIVDPPSGGGTPAID